MEFVNVVAAAAVGWLFGAFWYMVWAKPWLAVSGAKLTPEGKPAGGGSPLPFVLSAIAMLIVAGFMRHVFAMAGIETITKGFLSGLGIGLFFISPWTMINNAYPGRPFRLTLIDGGYSTIACALMGAVLAAF